MVVMTCVLLLTLSPSMLQRRATVVRPRYPALSVEDLAARQRVVRERAAAFTRRKNDARWRAIPMPPPMPPPLPHVPSLDDMSGDWIQAFAEKANTNTDDPFLSYSSGAHEVWRGGQIIERTPWYFHEQHAGRGLLNSSTFPHKLREMPTPLSVLVHRDLPVISSAGGLGSVAVSKGDCFSIDSANLPPLYHPNSVRCFMPQRAYHQVRNATPLSPEDDLHVGRAYAPDVNISDPLEPTRYGGVPLPRLGFDGCMSAALRVYSTELHKELLSYPFNRNYARVTATRWRPYEAARTCGVFAHSRTRLSARRRAVLWKLDLKWGANRVDLFLDGATRRLRSHSWSPAGDDAPPYNASEFRTSIEEVPGCEKDALLRPTCKVGQLLVVEDLKSGAASAYAFPPTAVGSPTKLVAYSGPDDGKHFNGVSTWNVPIIGGYAQWEYLDFRVPIDKSRDVYFDPSEALEARTLTRGESSPLRKASLLALFALPPLSDGACDFGSRHSHSLTYAEKEGSADGASDRPRARPFEGGRSQARRQRRGHL